ncbi:NmrA family NAD(P)-binding protein [Bacillus sp. S13(2024)]|uniref:NmrA family NAD(P)-binding protein n=1 Tax=unclassified Bacillus (in: firmicutes) TaxID=185979 RepID=UPI003D20DE81
MKNPEKNRGFMLNYKGNDKILYLFKKRTVLIYIYIIRGGIMDNTYKIAVIGGTGKVGRYIASEALKNGYQVRMLVRNPKKIKI